MALIGGWNFFTSVRFGAGRIAEIADAVKQARARSRYKY
jgi:hypothetical protein